MGRASGLLLACAFGSTGGWLAIAIPSMFSGAFNVGTMLTLLVPATLWFSFGVAVLVEERRS